MWKILSFVFGAIRTVGFIAVIAWGIFGGLFVANAVWLGGDILIEAIKEGRVAWGKFVGYGFLIIFFGPIVGVLIFYGPFLIMGIITAFLPDTDDKKEGTQTQAEIGEDTKNKE